MEQKSSRRIGSGSQPDEQAVRQAECGGRNSVNQIVLTGMVLSTMPVGEYDRRGGHTDKRTGEDISLCKRFQGVLTAR